MGTELGQMIAADLAQIKNSLTELSLPVAGAQDDGAAVAGSGGFADRMRDALHSVNSQDHEAGQLMASVDSGESDDLVGAMLASQQAGLSFSMLMQVRNKVVGAVDELIKMQL
jgi:flagellar hook-basal body complex protein FliE